MRKIGFEPMMSETIDLQSTAINHSAIFSYSLNIFLKYIININMKKLLLYNKKNFSGKNNSGKIMIKSRCVGHKKKYKFINFKISSIFLNGIIIKLEKISNKKNFVALVNFNLEKFFSPYLLNYILATNNLKIGSLFIKKDFSLYNNILPLKYIKKGIPF